LVLRAGIAEPNHERGAGHGKALALFAAAAAAGFAALFGRFGTFDGTLFAFGHDALFGRDFLFDLEDLRHDAPDDDLFFGSEHRHALRHLHVGHTDDRPDNHFRPIDLDALGAVPRAA